MESLFLVLFQQEGLVCAEGIDTQSENREPIVWMKLILNAAAFLGCVFLGGCVALPRWVPFDSARVEDSAVFDGKLCLLIRVNSGMRRRPVMGEGEHYETRESRLGVVAIIPRGQSTFDVKLIGRFKSNEKWFVHEVVGITLCDSNAFTFETNTQSLAKVIFPITAGPDDKFEIKTVPYDSATVGYHPPSRKVLFGCSDSGLVMDLNNMLPLGDAQSIAVGRQICDWRRTLPMDSLAVSDDIKWVAKQSGWPRTFKVYNPESSVTAVELNGLTNIWNIHAVEEVNGEFRWLISRAPNAGENRFSGILEVYTDKRGKVAQVDQVHELAIDAGLDHILMVKNAGFTEGKYIGVVSWRPFEGKIAEAKVSMAAIIRDLKHMH
jgi:hypothetical protein